MMAYGIIERGLYRLAGGKDRNVYDNITSGVVVDTNDPQQMGRVRVLCPSLGDNDTKDTADIPWARYMSPFGGSSASIARGTNNDEQTNETFGGVTYGMWNIPKVGAEVLVACIDGNPITRVWMGCLYGQFTPHTMPHGRFTVQGKSYEEDPEEGNVPGNNKPEGPLADDESPIAPLYANLKKAFGDGPDNKEWRTRAADYSVAAVDNQIVQEKQVYASIPDDKDELHGGKDELHGATKYRQGYGINRTNPNEEDEITTKVYDSQTYSWTTPGFHAMSMDDRVENCRMRFRSTTGHQIILDDTNERIYISTAEGKNWVEMDQSGNIDIHSERRISVHAAKDINFSTDETFRVHAKKGIHMYSGDETRIHSATDINIRSDQNIRMHSGQQTLIESDNDMNLKSATQFKASSASTMHFNSGGNMLLTGGDDIHLNGPTAGIATDANERQSFWTNRIPQHEPWGRIMMKKQNSDKIAKNSHVLELTYDDAKVGKKEIDDIISRGPHWRR